MSCDSWIRKCHCSFHEKHFYISYTVHIASLVWLLGWQFSLSTRSHSCCEWHWYTLFDILNYSCHPGHWRGEMGKIALAAIVSFLWVIPTTLVVNHIVPEPYMVRKNLLNRRTDSSWYLNWYLKFFPFIQYDRYPWFAGWDISYTTSTTVLQGKFWKLGPYDYNSSGPVCSLFSLWCT